MKKLFYRDMFDYLHIIFNLFAQYLNVTYLIHNYNFIPFTEAYLLRINNSGEKDARTTFENNSLKKLKNNSKYILQLDKLIYVLNNFDGKIPLGEINENYFGACYGIK